jgi:transposase
LIAMMRLLSMQNPSKRPCCIHCDYPRVRIKATYQRTLKHTRQGNQLITLYLKAPKYHCPRCGRYFRHRFKGVRPRYRASEAFRLEVFETHDGGVTQAKLTRTHGISAATTERWYHGHCRAACIRDVEPALPQGPGHR